MNSMKGKRVVITGPTSGVGKEIAMELSALGAEIIHACRDLKKGNKTASEITRRTGSAKLSVMQVDTSSQKSIREFAREFRKKYRRLDVLINNAAGNRGTLPKVNSEDGIELTFAANVVGYFLLTQELLPVLGKSAPARIINVASQYASDLDLDNLQFEGASKFQEKNFPNRKYTTHRVLREGHEGQKSAKAWILSPLLCFVPFVFSGFQKTHARLMDY